MIDEFRKYYYTQIFKLIQTELKKIAEEFQLNYQELENEYLHHFHITDKK